MSVHYFIRPASMVQVEGNDRLDLVHRLCTNTLRPLHSAHRAVSALFTTAQGKLIDWTDIVSEENCLRLSTSVGRAATVAAWINRYTIAEDVRATDVSVAWGQLTVFGTRAAGCVGLEAVPEAGECVWHDGLWRRGLAAFGDCLEGWIAADAMAAWAVRLAAGGASSLAEQDYQWRRLEAGIPSAQGEFATEVNPLELRLTAHAVGWNKGCYIGQEVISRLDSYDKVARLLIGFSSQVPLHYSADLKLAQDKRLVGRVTSVANRGGKSCGLAVVKRDCAHPGVACVTLPSGDETEIELVDRPFWQASSPIHTGRHPMS